MQEVSTAILPRLQEFLESKKLKVLAVPYNPSAGDSTFNYVFAYDINLFSLVGTEQIYLTESGHPLQKREPLAREEIFSHNFDSEFEKSSQMVILEKKDSREQFIVVNNHFGMSNEHRLLAAQSLCQKLLSIQKPIILVGDFNQFDSSIPEVRLYQEQIEVFKQHGFTWVISPHNFGHHTKRPFAFQNIQGLHSQV